MGKRWLAVLLVLLLMVLAACGGSTTPDTGDDEGSDEGTTAQATAEPTEEEMEPTAEPTEEEMEPTAEPTEEEMEPTPEPEATEEGEDEGETGEMAPIETVCLVTDLGAVNDGTFNQFAYEGMVRAAEEFGLESDFIETQSQTDYDSNIQTCVDEGFDAIVTVGFLIADATLAAAEANPEIMFIGVDQFFEAPPENLVGIQYREDQGGFLAGAIACMVTESDIVGGVYGQEIPPVVKFRNGFENGCRYVNPDATTLGVYHESFITPDEGASTANQFLGEGADVIFGAGGPTGSGGIRAAAEAGAWVIGVDQDEFLSTFGEGDTPGADRILTSAVKRVDLGVYDQLRGLVETDSGLWSGGGLYILEAANDGITYAPFHDAEESIPEAARERLEEIRQQLADGELMTGVDPILGGVIEDEIPESVPFEP